MKNKTKLGDTKFVDDGQINKIAKTGPEKTDSEFVPKKKSAW